MNNMAKLNVVIPAVEVTVDGVAYRRVDRKAQAGDIVKALKSEVDLTEGAFYGPLHDSGVGNTGFKDDVNDFRYSILRNYASQFEVFAPISAPASQPPTDTITFQGATWRKVNRDVREGDAIKFTDEDRHSYLTESELYVVDYVDGAGDPHITDDDEDSHDAYNDDYEVYEKVTDIWSVDERKFSGLISPDFEGVREYVVLEPVNAEPTESTQPERLKVGEYARVVEQDHHALNLGDIVEIIETDESTVPYRFQNLETGRTAWTAASRLVRATDEEVAAAKRAALIAQFREGDKVRLISGGGTPGVRDYVDGEVYTIKNPKYDSSPSGIQITGGGQPTAYVGADQIVKLTAKEVAEIEREAAKQAEEKRWAAIGRKVNEYKRGDIVKFIRSDRYNALTPGDVGEVVEKDFDGDLRVNTQEITEGNWCTPTQISLIVPVEQRFDRPSAESAAEEVDAA